MNNFTITEQEPEIIGQVENGGVQMNTLESPPEPEMPSEKEITPEPTKDTINEEMGQFEQEFNEKLDALLAETKQKASEIFKSKDTLHKTEMETTTDEMSKTYKGEMEKTTTKITTEHKKEMAKRDKEMAKMQQMMKKKDAELTELKAKVKEALMAD